ncbi:MAG: nuclear transport factor 2 family protein [Nevskia sp.]|nr:nuclear transport factor 2 family protein [Nevskia sp.]
MSDEQVFFDRFADAWKIPTAERIVSVLHEDAVLYQPMAAPLHGRAAGQANFSALLQALPGFNIDIKRWSGSAGVVFIEFQMVIPARSDELRVDTIDRFLLRGEYAYERRTYFNPAALLAALAVRPTLWAGFIKYQLAGSRTQ